MNASKSVWSRVILATIVLLQSTTALPRLQNHRLQQHEICSDLPELIPLEDQNLIQVVDARLYDGGAQQEKAHERYGRGNRSGTRAVILASSAVAITTTKQEDADAVAGESRFKRFIKENAKKDNATSISDQENKLSSNSRIDNKKQAKADTDVLIDKDKAKEKESKVKVEQRSPAKDERTATNTIKDSTTKTTDLIPPSNTLRDADKFNQQKQLQQSTVTTKPSAKSRLESVQDEIALKQQQSYRSNAFWPPWPFSLLTKNKNNSPDIVPTRPRRGIVWSYARQSTEIGFRQVQLVSSQLWFHMPPGLTPLLLIAGIPRRVVLSSANNKNAAAKTIIPLFSNAFVRSIALSGVGLAILSWGHSELHRKRNQTPMPLTPSLRDTKRVLLPPFLPPIAHYYDTFQSNDDSQTIDNEDNEPLLSPEAVANNIHIDRNNNNASDDSEVSPRLLQHWNSLMDRAPKPLTWKSRAKNWRGSKQTRQVERHNARRMAIYDELVALQALKRKAAKLKQQQQQQQKDSETRSSNSWLNKSYWKNGAVLSPESDLGYALVTGASKGIGRAIAVELARWEIPLILVSRDSDKLISLAQDIETCYGVKCCVLPADLSRPDSAKKIYEATSRAGLKVDFLINNAGRAAYGMSLNLPSKLVNKIVQLNTVSAVELTQLYAQDMKRRNRGRVLFMSSICGAVAGLPSVALYSATKAFENSYGLALAHELEPYGVGVTTIMPGAVRGTDFKQESRSEESLCWKIPFYAKRPEQVASWSVRAMLNGDTEATMGWQNRFFLRVMKPALPQRIHNILAEVFWKPLPFKNSQQNGSYKRQYIDSNEDTTSDVISYQSPWSHNELQNTPLLLKLEEDKVPVAPPPPMPPAYLPPAPSQPYTSTPQDTNRNDTIQPNLFDPLASPGSTDSSLYTPPTLPPNQEQQTTAPPIPSLPPPSPPLPPAPYPQPEQLYTPPPPAPPQLPTPVDPTVTSPILPNVNSNSQMPSQQMKTKRKGAATVTVPRNDEPPIGGSLGLTEPKGIDF